MGDLRSELKKLSVSGEFFEFGTVYLIDNDKVSATLKKFYSWNTPKEKERPVMIIQNYDGNKQPLSPNILIAPISATAKPTTLDVPVKAGEAKIDRDSIIQISLIEPMPKAFLEGRKLGKFPDIRLEEIRARILQKFGLIPIVS